MWLMKNFVMEDFAAEVKKGKYKKIDYQTWRELKELPEAWDLNVQMYTDSTSETNPVFSFISWGDGNYPYEFPANDGSLGEYIKTLVESYTQTYSLADYNDYTCTSVSSNFYEKQPTVEITEKGLKVNGQSLNEMIDEAAGFSINRKENDSMTNLFKGFDFGSCENDNVKMSMYGIAVKNANGTWVSYDAKSDSIIDVDILNFNAKYLYKMPVAIKDITKNDVIIHNRKPMFVSKIEDGKILAIDPAAGEEKVVILTRNMFGFDFVIKVVNLFGSLSEGASADQPFGNVLPLMLLADGGKADDMLPLMFAMGGGNFDMSNPMMMYFLMKDNSNSDMLPLMFAMNGNLFGKHECKCETCNR